jgi:hypothetical protein
MLITEFMPHGSLTEVLRNAALQGNLSCLVTLGPAPNKPFLM